MFLTQLGLQLGGWRRIATLSSLEGHCIHICRGKRVQGIRVCPSEHMLFVKILAPTFIICILLGKIFNLFVPQFLHL